jgi:hypothetical protein
MNSGVLKAFLMLPSFICLLLSEGCRSPISKPAILGSPEIASSRFLPFDRSLIAKYGLSNGGLQNLKFYNSKEIVLRRILPQSANTSGKPSLKGKLVSVGGQAYDEITIPQYSPASFSGASLNESSFTKGPDQIFLAFENGGPPLVFSTDANSPVSQFVLFRNSGQMVLSDDLEYVPIGDTSRTVLLIEKSSLSSLNGERRVIDKLLLQEWQ